MALQTVELLFGLILAVVTLRDVFDTVVVPGGSRASLKIARRIVLVMLPVWKRFPGRRGGVSTGFAPAALLTAFVVWLVLLVLGFGLMLHALSRAFSPPLEGFAGALYMAGNALATIGPTGTTVQGAARWIVLSGSFCGLAVMTMAVTYLLEIQGSTAQRDSGIMKFLAVTGDPPSGLGLLERYAALGCRGEIVNALRAGRDWCAGVLQSHASHPSLIYFRSVGTGSGWPATLGALMDTALIVELLIDLPDAKGPAVLLCDQGHRLARDVGGLIGLEPRGAEAEAEAGAGEALCARLRSAGYRVSKDADLERFMAARADHADRVRALAEHLGTAEAPLVPQQGG
jgi:hypothetical protein